MASCPKCNAIMRKGRLTKVFACPRHGVRKSDLEKARA